MIINCHEIITQVWYWLQHERFYNRISLLSEIYKVYGQFKDSVTNKELIRVQLINNDGIMYLSYCISQLTLIISGYVLRIMFFKNSIDKCKIVDEYWQRYENEVNAG